MPGPREVDEVVRRAKDEAVIKLEADNSRILDRLLDNKTHLVSIC